MELIKCNLCGSADYKLLSKNKDRLCEVDQFLFNIVECKNCGLAFINPQPSPSELEKYYPENYSPYNDLDSFKYGPVSRLIKKIIVASGFKKDNKAFNKTNDNSIKNYLDFGCGSGGRLQQIRESHPNWNFYGTDISPIACQKSAEKGFNVLCGDILEMKNKLPQKYFDIVSMSHVIEHLYDPKAVLTEINKTMKDNGRITIVTPNFDSLAAKLFKKYWYALDVPRHLFFFTPKNLALLLKQTGFSVKKINYAPGPRVEILSLYYWLGKKDRRINPIVWRIFKPAGFILSKLKKTSVMTIDAVK